MDWDEWYWESDRHEASCRDRGSLLVLGVRLQHQLAQLVLRRGVAGDRAQQREASPLTVDGGTDARET